MTHHHRLTPTQRRLCDIVVCEAAMGVRSERRILSDLRSEADADDLSAVSAALRERHRTAGVVSSDLP